MKLRNFLIFSLILLSFLFIQFQLIGASLDTAINIIDGNKDGDFYMVPTSGLTLSYFFNTGETIVKNIDSGQVSSINLEQELFCYKNCNIVPKRVIYKTDIQKDNELLSRQEMTISNPDNKQIVDIYLGEKINAKTESVPPKSTINSYDQQSVPTDNYVVEWNGRLNITDLSEYVFSISIFGGIKINLDDNLILDNWTEGNDNNRIFTANLSEGTHILNISYWTNESDNLNLFWKKIDSGNDPTIISEDNLIFDSGFIKQEKKGADEMRALLSTANAPESYPINYQTYPTAFLTYYAPINSQRTPILLVHGLHGSDDVDINDQSTWNYWNNIPSQLKSYNNDVWTLYYSPANVSNFMTSGLLKNEINVVLSYYSTSKLDVVSHSMGGLVTLGYIEGLGKTSYGDSVVYGNNIRKYIAIAGPLHGSFSANKILNNQDPASYGCNWFAKLFGISPKDKNAQAYLDLAVGGEFTWLLSQNPLNNQIDYLNIVGNQGISCVPDETKEENSGDNGSGNDGLVAITSASLLDKNVPLIILGDYNHANEAGRTAIPEGWTFDASREVNMINAFIKGYGTTTIKSYLNYGLGDFYIDPSDPTSNPFNKGAVTVKITSLTSINSVQLKKSGDSYSLTKFNDILHGSQTNNWFYFSNDNVSMYYPTQDYSNPKYGLTLPKGVYQIYINNVYSNQNIEIKGAQTSTKEINLLPSDSDGDGVPDSQDACPAVYGILCNGCPNPSCQQGYIYYCPTSGAPTCIADSSCLIPWNGMDLLATATLCRGNYSLPNGINIVDNNIILDCNFSKITGETDGKTYNSLSTGFDLLGSNITLKNCIIANYSTGIYSSSNNVKSNYILNNTISINFKGLDITNNHVVFDNKIVNNRYGVLVTTNQEEGLKMYKNDIYNNPSVNLFSSFDYLTLNATDNWWGTTDSETINATILGSIEYIPYSTSPHKGISCVPNWTFQENWSSCNLLDLQFRTWVDLNSCDDTSMGDLFTANQSCDYCTPNKTAIETCHTDDTMTGYFNDTNKCFEQTGLLSDLVDNVHWGNPCDYCTPNWTQAYTSCKLGDYKIGWYNDSNSCYGKTNLASDLSGRPSNVTLNLSCDFNGDGYIGNTSNIVSNITNLNFSKINNTFFEFREGNKTLLNFDLNLTNFSINFGQIFIEKDSNQSSFAYLIIKGLDLTIQNKTKTIYLDRILNGTGICVKDTELTSITEIGGSCNGLNEFWLKCPGSNGNYSCELFNNNTQYKISGLRHSGVREQATYCGDSVCNGGESCTSCSSDCGTCPAPPSGGGGGGGGGAPTKKVNGTTNNTSGNISSLNIYNNGLNQSNNRENSTEKFVSQTKFFSFITGAVVGTKEGNWLIGISILIIFICVSYWIVANKKERK